jgi:hypothetical protein
MSVEQEYRPEPELPNLVELETGQAYYRIFYNNHSIPSDPESLKGCDAFFTEFVYRDLQSVGQRFEESLKKDAPSEETIFKSDQQGIRPVILRVAETNVPIFLVDASNRSLEATSLKDEFFSKLVVKIAEGGAALFVLKSLNLDLAKDISSDKKMSRRDFLKRGLKLAGGSYLISPAIESVAEWLVVNTEKQPDERTWKRWVQRETAGVNQWLHPEFKTKLVDFRNTLMAQKSEAAAKVLQQTLQRKPTILLAVGGAHFGIEKSFRQLEQTRIEEIKGTLKDKTGIENVVVRIDFLPQDEEGNRPVEIQQIPAWQ